MHWVERAFVYFALAAVALNWPWVWLSRTSPLDVENVDARGTAIFLVMFLIAAGVAAPHWWTIKEIARAEPALPLLLLLALVSVLWSGQPDIAIRRSVALSLSAAFGLYLAVRVPFPQLLRMVAWVVLLRVLVDYAMIFGLPSYGVDQNGLWQGRSPGKNNLGRDAVLAAVVMTWQVVATRSARFVFLGGVLLSLGLVLGSQSTTSFVSAILLIAALPVYQLLRAKKTLFGAVVVSLGGGSLLAASIALSQLEAITSALGKDVTLTGRTVLWTESLAAIWEQPLFGQGYASFWTGWFGPNHDIWVALGTFRTPHSHNGLIDVMLDLGIVGGLLYATLFGRGLIRAVRFCRIHPGTAGLFPLAYLALSVLGSSTEHGILTRNSLLWVLFVTVICVLTTVKGEEDPLTAVRSPDDSKTRELLSSR